MKKSQTFKLSFAFSLFIFSNMILSVTALSILLIFINNMGYLINPNPLILFGVLLFSSAFIGILMAAMTRRTTLTPIVKLNRAMREVAKGNFNIELKEESRIIEIKEMTENFNVMTRELGSIETFRNDFVSNVSHEFKTPISAIEGYTTLLQDESLNEEERNEYITNILGNTKRLSNLSDNILKISRLENQEIMIEKTGFKLDEQIRQAILMLEADWTEKSSELDIELDPVIYHGNEELLLQVWTNLLSNAIKFTPGGGTIKVALSQSEDTVTVIISDNGMGMPEDVKKHIFEKFYQGDKSHSQMGNGLGLTLVKRIVDLHEGSIDVKSEEGIGTEFIVLLP